MREILIFTKDGEKNSETMVDYVSEHLRKGVISELNINSEQTLAERYNVQNTPTLLVLENGKVVGRANELDYKQIRKILKFS